MEAFKHLKKDKVSTIKKSKGSFDTNVLLSQKGIRNIVWWHENVMGLENDIVSNLGLFSLIAVSGEHLKIIIQDADLVLRKISTT